MPNNDKVTLYHPELDTTVTVPVKAVASHRRRGWTEVAPDKVGSHRPRANATRAEWQRYAKRLGLPVDKSDGRADIRSNVEQFERTAAETNPPKEGT